MINLLNKNKLYKICSDELYNLLRGKCCHLMLHFKIIFYINKLKK